VNRLNLGSGDYPAPAPWINIDQFSGGACRPDVVAPASSLPYKDGSAEAVYCGHLLEHLTLDDELPKTLEEIHRVLAPQGRACFVGPDCDRAEADPQWWPLLGLIRDGGNRWPGDVHVWRSSATTALEAIRSVFPRAYEIAITQVDEFWPLVSDVGWQFAILT
jgi:SAM-dependent methyltransferase